MTIAQQIEKIKQELRNYYSPNEIWTFIHLIFEHVTGWDRTFVHAHPETQIPENAQAQIKQIVRELKSYKPIQYILGYADFMGLKLKVTPDVLIPRPETEELVSLIIEENSDRKNLNIIDIGTGSGCIIIALAKLMPGNNYFATDIKPQALKVAKYNAQLHGVNIKFQIHDIIATYPPVFDGQTFKYDIIVSNPPYLVPSAKNKISSTVLNYEPEDALFVSENQPLIFYEAILWFAQHNAAPKAKIYLEINEEFDRQLVKLLNSRGYTNYSIIRDLSGKSRILRINL